MALSDLLARLRRTPDERGADCCERCMESLYDDGRVPTARMGEHQQATIDAERRRWESGRHAQPDA